MTRYATWRRRPEDTQGSKFSIVPKDTPISPDERRRIGVLTSFVALAFVISLPIGFPAPLFVGILGIAIIAMIVRPGAREHAAIPPLGDDASFPVTMEICDGRRVLGRENGWIALADGWLVYEGLRTSFSFTNEGVGIRRFGNEFRLRLPDGRTLRLVLLTDFMQTIRPARWIDARRMRGAMDKWRKAPRPVGSSIFPPKTPSPLVLRGQSEGILLLTVLFPLLGVVAATLGGWIISALSVLMAVLCAYWYRRTARATREAIRQTEWPPPWEGPAPLQTAPEREAV